MALAPNTKSDFIKIYESIQLNEIKFEDQYGKRFMEFYDKYKKKPFNSDKSLYVNFSNTRTDNMSKFVPSSGLGHSDPRGHYGYPLDYILKHPSDVMYGKSATYLVVSKARDNGNTLWLQHMQNSQMEQLFHNAHKDWWWSDAYPMLKKFWTNTGPLAIWFRAVQLEPGQLDVIAEYFKEKKRNTYTAQRPDLKVKTAEAQSNFFISNGYNAIKDTATNSKKAVINDREPEQIIFLTNDSYDIVEHFLIRGEKQKDKATERGMTSLDYKHEDAMARKIASGVANGIGDKMMSSPPLTSNQGGWKVFFTNLGRRISVYFEVPSDYYTDKKFGEKKHKEFKKSNNLRVKINIFSEKKTVEYLGWDDDTFAEIISGTVKKWNDESETNPNFTKTRTDKEYETLERNRRTKDMQEKLAASIDQYVDNDPTSFDVKELKGIADYFKVFFPAELTKPEAFLYEWMIQKALEYSRWWDEPEKIERWKSLVNVPEFITNAGPVSDKVRDASIELRQKIMDKLTTEKYEGKTGHQSWKGDVRDYYGATVLTGYLNSQSDK